MTDNNQVVSAHTEILKGLSVILAGFKLATIVMAYIGAGSVAKWVIDRWYPFTRWIWDQVVDFLTLPMLTDMQKDSLTALVFFAPLGVSSVASMRKRSNSSTNSQISSFASILGALYIVIVCKEILESLAEKISLSTGYAIELLNFLNSVISDYFIVIISISIPFYLFAIYSMSRESHQKYESNTGIIGVTSRLAAKFHPNISRTKSNILKITVYLYILLSIILIIIATPRNELPDLVFPIIVMSLILGSVLLARKHAPLTLLMIAGSFISFIGAAVGFEILTVAIRFVDSVATGT